MDAGQVRVTRSVTPLRMAFPTLRDPRGCRASQCDSQYSSKSQKPQLRQAPGKEIFFRPFRGQYRAGWPSRFRVGRGELSMHFLTILECAAAVVTLVHEAVFLVAACVKWFEQRKRK